MVAGDPRNQELLAKFKGSLLGGALGDALGAPFEGRPRAFFEAGTVMLDEFQRMPGYPPGQYTDDTQLAVVVAESLIQNGRVVGEDVASRFKQLFAKGQIIGAGRATSLAIGRLLAGTPWNQAAAEEGEAGNGPASRSTVLGLWHHDRVEQLPEEAALLGRITHRDRRAQAGAVAMARAVAYCVDNKRIDSTAFLEAVAGPVKPIDSTFHGLLEQLDSWVHLSESSALPSIVRSGAARPDAVEVEEGIPGFVIPTVLAVFYFFLRYNDDFELCLQETIRAGGDVDTTASLAGSLCGALHGFDVLPENLVAGIQNHRYLVDVAERLFRRKTSN